jgi:hypothetical protein
MLVGTGRTSEVTGRAKLVGIGRTSEVTGCTFVRLDSTIQKGASALKDGAGVVSVFIWNDT